MKRWDWNSFQITTCRSCTYSNLAVTQGYKESQHEYCFSTNRLLLGFYLRKKELATLTGRAPELWLGFVAGLCVQALSSSCLPLGRAPELWAMCPGLVAGLCGWALSSSCPPLVLVLAAPLNSVAGLCGPALRPHLSTRVTQKALCFQFSGLSLLYLHPPPIYI